MKSTPLLDTPSACPGMLSPSGTFIRKQSFQTGFKSFVLKSELFLRAKKPEMTA